MSLRPMRHGLFLALRHGLSFVLRDHQQILVRLAKSLGVVPAQVDEIEPQGFSRRRQRAELDAPVVYPIDRHPGIDVHAFGAAKPTVP